ncbi:4Fe-4S dicluster domain-containing protein [Desulfohalovibrio reitneri]|uniref:4Fe-4S dicluster domain-containing protein n=1 Tax=Desulfohalovibrio reitneri TaxID=1307759 RepID=UPI0004A6B08B|nr:4Fe-4S dicluster domain-containing protein [Desulfohalovibrio reitneri]
MSTYMIKTNKKRCISCKACEVHCKLKNRVPEGAKLGLLASKGPVKKGGKPTYLNQFMPCFHCEKPWCVSACPTGAMIRRESDGIVYVDQELCVGCKACIMACPWEVPQWQESTGTVIKCDYCMDRVDEGLDPACVTACTAHALEFLRPNRDSDRVRKNYAREKFLT